MNTLVLAFIFAVGALALLAYAFLMKEPPASASAKGPDLGEPISRKLGLQLNTLEEEIGKLSSEHGLLKEQLELAKSIECGFKDDLAQFRQLKSGLAGDSEKAAHKEAELDKELARSANIIQEIKAKIDKINQPQQQDNKEMIDRIASLETKISEYKLAIEAQAKDAQSRNISEEEHNNLKKQLTAQEEALHKYKQEKTAMSEECSRMKEKLEQAEEILKIIHAEK